jgi:hypothetical protein
MPKNKTQWRKDYAVKDSWNDNGYYIEETVGPDGLKVDDNWRPGSILKETITGPIDEQELLKYLKPGETV